MCSKPKVPQDNTVIRQPYKTPNTREALAGAGDNETRRRLIAGIATSARGIETPASTTKRVRAGGDAPILPLLGGAPGNVTGASPPPAVTPAPAAAQANVTPIAQPRPRPALGSGGMSRNIAAVMQLRRA